MSNAYKFTFEGTSVTNIQELDDGRWKSERIDGNETWIYDPTTNSVTKSELEHGQIQTSSYTDANGDGIFIKTTNSHNGTLSNLNDDSSSPPSIDYRNGDAHRFTFDGSTITSVEEFEHGIWKTDTIDSNETWSYDPGASTVTKTEQEHGLTETSVYTDVDGDGIFTRSSKTYTGSNGAIWTSSHHGGEEDDNWVGSNSRDFYHGDIGDDSLNGGTGEDDLYGGDGSDNIYGGSGSDHLYGGAGNDSLYGGLDDDYLYSADGDDTVDAGDGDDLIIGGDGAGNDTYKGGKGIDTVKYTSAEDRISIDLTRGTATSTAGGDIAGIGSDKLSDIENVIGGNFSDTIIGSKLSNNIWGQDGNDQISGLSGNDKLYGEAGNDRLLGGDGDDSLYGGGGVDILSGGKGKDTFVFEQLSDLGVGLNNRELITDFQRGSDKINLSAVDANALLTGDQSFSFIGASNFSGSAGQLRFSNGVISGDTNGDSIADFEIGMTGVSNLRSSDFNL